MPGSIRSGENASEKSIPAVSPDVFSSSGRTTSSVVPGYVVDSSDTSVPGRSSRPAASAAARTAPRSGPSASDSGVGTQITITSCGPISASSDVARNPRARACDDLGGGDVVHVRPAGVQPRRDLRAGVEAGHLEPGPGRLDGQRQADVTEPDDQSVLRRHVPPT